ncbi:MAG: methyltransferase [Flavobacteriaceae bacterium]|nr:methyltransferase [Flavobacteriaceae bacterium]
MSVFKFKQFNVNHEFSAAKVGTDGVLTGAWAPFPENCKNALDIGSGTGIIALMLAQRHDSVEITGVEKDYESWKECCQNFNNSPWQHRLQAVNSSIENFNTQIKFDLIVSNPPFHTESTLSPNLRRDMARSASHLSFSKLVKKVETLLSKQGFFVIIFPYSSKEENLKTAMENQLFPQQILNIKGTPSTNYKRCLIRFGRKQVEMIEENLVIEKERHHYTEEFRHLVKDFYLKM